MSQSREWGLKRRPTADELRSCKCQRATPRGAGSHKPDEIRTGYYRYQANTSTLRETTRQCIWYSYSYSSSIAHQCPEQCSLVATADVIKYNTSNFHLQ
eukprot:scaffold10515_cov24-Prasinocladus_malaysianus.AAC.1